MSSIAISSIVFGCVFGSATLTMLIRRYLPDHHLSADSRDVVKVGLGLIATLTALVLGMLIATAKGSYDAQSSAINELSANYLMLDRILDRYGSEAKETRGYLKDNIAATINQIWPQEGPQAGTLVPVGQVKTSGDALFDHFSSLTPKTEAQRELRARAIGIMADTAQLRMRLVARQGSALPTPFLLILVLWLIILFGGYGLLAPCNGTVIAMLFVCTLSVAGAIFLTVEMTTPFAGVMRVSSDPMVQALSIIGQ